MRKSKLYHFLLLCTLLVGFKTLSAEQATLDALGVLPGTSLSFASGISDDGGTVVGGSTTNHFGIQSLRSHPVGQAFIWGAAGGMVRLAALNQDHDSSWAEGISADGKIVVGAATDAAGQFVPVRWDQGQPTSLALPSGGSGTAVVISADGSTIVGIDGLSHVLRWRHGRPESLLAAPFLNYAEFAISASGNDGVVCLTANDNLFRWSDPLGALPARISPTALDGLTHNFRAAAMTADGQRFFVSTSGDSSLAPNGAYQWTGLNDGQPIPTYQAAAAYGYIPRLATSASGNLLAATAITTAALPDNGAILITPFGPLPFAPLLQAQGADTSRWAALTNITAMSADGRWLAGAGGLAGAVGAPGQIVAFRAKLVLHAEGEPALKVSATTDVFNRTTTDLRWPASDLLVTVESVPALHPALPWQPEVGTPRIEGNEIVLRLYQSNGPRYFRLRRLD